MRAKILAYREILAKRLFLGELKNFNDRMGYKKGLEARGADFISVVDEYRDAVKLEKILEQSGVFSEKLCFSTPDGQPNEKIIKYITERGGPVNDTSYDRMIYNLLYWYANYTVVYDGFLRRRLGKEPFKLEELVTTKGLLHEWRDQKNMDVRGLPQSPMMSFINEEEDKDVIREIEENPIGYHLKLEDKFRKERLWQDAVLWYADPILNPKKHERRVQEYCHQRKNKLHYIVDLGYQRAIRERTFPLEQLKDLFTPDGQHRMYDFVVKDYDGTLIGKDETDSRKRARFRKLQRERQAAGHTTASEIKIAGIIFNLTWESQWGWKPQVMVEQLDAEGLFKFQIQEVWYGVVENDRELYWQVREWYEELKDFPDSAWEKDEDGKYEGIPQILVGFAREHLKLDPKGRKIDLRSDEAEAQRQFLKEWLYGQKNEAYFNKAFQILIAKMFGTINVGEYGFPKDEDPLAPRPQIPPQRFLYMGELGALISQYKNNPRVIDRFFWFFDPLMREVRQGEQTWQKFFEENGQGQLADKEETLRIVTDLFQRDKMYSTKLVGEKADFIKDIFNLNRAPNETGFSMADEIIQQLRTGWDAGKFTDMAEVRQWLYHHYGINVGKQRSIAQVYKKIERKCPSSFEEYQRILKKECEIGKNIFKAFFNNTWLDKNRVIRPNWFAAQENLRSLDERLEMIDLDPDRHFGVLMKTKIKTQRSYHDFMVERVFAEQFMTLDQRIEEFKKLRSQIPTEMYSFSWLKLLERRFFGLWSRPQDYSTDFILSLHYRTIPLIGAATLVLGAVVGALEKLGNQKKLQNFMSSINRGVTLYLDAPWASVGWQAAGMTAVFGIGMGIIGAGFWPVAGVAFGVYEGINAWYRLRRSPKIIKKYVDAQQIEDIPQAVFLKDKGDI